MDKFFNKQVIDIPVGPVERYCYTTAITYEFYSMYAQADPVKRVNLGKLYVELIEKMKSVSGELTSTMLVTLGNIPKNDELQYMAGIHIIAGMIRAGTMKKELVENLKSITKILAS